MTVLRSRSAGRENREGGAHKKLRLGRMTTSLVGACVLVGGLTMVATDASASSAPKSDGPHRHP